MDIKSVIKKYGETTYTVAEKMGIAQPSVMQYINGNPTARKLEDIARAIGCSPAEFFADWNEPLRQDAQPPAADPAPAAAEPSQADELPFNDDNKPTASVQGALICPHCHQPFTVEIKG